MILSFYYSLVTKRNMHEPHFSRQRLGKAGTKVQSFFELCNMGFELPKAIS